MTNSEEIAQLKQQVVQLQNELRSLSQAHLDLVKQLEVAQRSQGVLTVDEFSLGMQNSCIKMNREGLWIGKRSFTEAASTPPAGTAIDINGDFHPKGGVSGSFVADGGAPTITVTRGIITSIA